MRNPENSRSLPSYTFGFRQNRYAIDAQRQLVIPIDQRQLQIDVSSVPVNDGVMAFVFDDVTGKILDYDRPGDPNFQHFTHLQIPALGLLDPEGARLARERELLRRDVRDENVLSTIDFAGTRFTVDAARYEFRQLDDPSNKIPMSDLEGSMAEPYFYYNATTRNVHWGLFDPDNLPKDVHRIDLPELHTLDPVGLARYHGFEDTFYLHLMEEYYGEDNGPIFREPDEISRQLHAANVIAGLRSEKVQERVSNYDPDRNLPEYRIGGRRFTADCQLMQLKEVGGNLNRIDLNKVVPPDNNQPIRFVINKYHGSLYTAPLNPLNIPSELEVVTLPNLYSIDPVGLARGDNRNDDWYITPETQHFLDAIPAHERRVSSTENGPAKIGRVLPEIHMGGIRWTIDAFKNEFRETAAPWNRISMDAIKVEDGKNFLMLDVKERCADNGVPDPEYDRNNVKRIQLPTIAELDPIGLARKEGKHDAYYMNISIARLARDPELNYKEGRVI